MKLSITEYYLEDCIQMLGFIPPPSDKKKKKDRDELGEEMDQEVKYLFTQIVIITFVHNSSKCLH